MKKPLAIAAACALTAAAALSAAQPANASTVFPVYNSGAWLSYEGMINDCLRAEVYLTTVDTTIVTNQGVIVASDHGEGSLRIVDTCHLTPPECDEDCGDEPGPTTVLSAGLGPTKGATIDATALAKAKYRENQKVSSSVTKRVKFAIDWKGRGTVSRTVEHEEDESGVFLRLTESRKATATFTIVAGPYTIKGSTKKAAIWQSMYNQP